MPRPRTLEGGTLASRTDRAPRSSRLEPIAWLLAIALAAFALYVTDYRTRDPDSRLHVAIEARQAERPVSEWIAPEWGGLWNSYGLYREHPVGTFVPPMILIRLGYPPLEAGYLVNAVYQALTILLFLAFASRFVPRRDARTLAWLLQLIPIAFTYRIRANHEQGLIFFVLLALYATERAREQRWWAPVIAVAMVGTLLVKGIFALLVPAVCASWLLVTSLAEERERGESWVAAAFAGLRQHAWAWAGIALAVAASAVVTIGYENAYRQVTGESFIAEYLRRQMGAATVQQQAGAWLLLQKIVNALWYLGRLAWFAFPWSLVLVGAAVGYARRRGTRVPYRGIGGPRLVAALAGLLAVSAVWVAAFSLFDRRADRFIFPAYFFVAGAGAAYALWVSPRVQRVVERVERFYPYEIAAVWLITFILHLASAQAGVPIVKL